MSRPKLIVRRPSFIDNVYDSSSVHIPSASGTKVPIYDEHIIHSMQIELQVWLVQVLAPPIPSIPSMSVMNGLQVTPSCHFDMQHRP